MAEILSTKELSKKYKNFFALDNVSINVNKGDVYGLVGQNGAGKTTLFKLVMGLTDITTGDILIDGNKNLRKARRSMGFMIGLSFFSHLNAYQNIEYYRKMKGISDKGETKRVLELVDMWGERAKKPFKSFSLGMKQRVGIANALLGNPPIVVLDEPVNGLDPQGIADIRSMIKQVNSDMGCTFIISSHILSELDLVATKFGFIDHGKLLKEISHEELHKHTGKSLVIEVDDNAKAVRLLKEKFNIDAHVADSGEISMNSHLDKAHEISKIMVENNLNLFTIKRQETTLEEYYIRLVGGAANV